MDQRLEGDLNSSGRWIFKNMSAGRIAEAPDARWLPSLPLSVPGPRTSAQRASCLPYKRGGTKKKKRDSLDPPGNQVIILFCLAWVSILYQLRVSQARWTPGGFFDTGEGLPIAVDG